MQSTDEIVTYAFRYGVYGMNEAISEDYSYRPEFAPVNPAPMMRGRSVNYIVLDPFSFGYVMGFDLPGPRGTVPGGKGADDVLAVIAIVALVFSSLTALAISAYQSVRAYNYINGAEHGKNMMKAQPNHSDPEVNQRIINIYTRASVIQANLANKKICYAVSAFLIGAGCALLTVAVAMAVFSRVRFNIWALAGTGFAAVGLGITGAITTRLITWLPKKEEVARLDDDIHWLNQKHPLLCIPFSNSYI